MVEKENVGANEKFEVMELAGRHVIKLTYVNEELMGLKPILYMPHGDSDAMQFAAFEHVK